MNRESQLGINHFGLRITAYTDNGDRKYNEDRFHVVYQKDSSRKGLEFVFIGVFDGHGGSHASEFAKNHLMNYIVDQERFWSGSDEDILEAIRKGFVDCHRAMWLDLDQWPRSHNGLPSTAGTTASIAFIRKGKIYIGHVGDSGIVLGSQDEEDGDLTDEMLTEDHKPESKKEHKRIRIAGGNIARKIEDGKEIGPFRVVWYRPTPYGYQELPFLNVARSLGDLWSYNRMTEQFMVSPEPDVSVIELDPNKHKCLIFASDGLLNVMEGFEVVKLFSEAEMRNSQSDRAWINPSRLLVESAKGKWLGRADNITVVTVAIDPKSTTESVENESAVQAVYDYSTNDCYNLDYMDPYAQHAQASSNITYCASRVEESAAFVNACCQDQRYVLAKSEETIYYHNDYEHHRKEYEEMQERSFPPLHYAYKFINGYIVRPTEEEFARMHKNDTRLMEEFNDPKRCETPDFETDEEIDFSDTEEAGTSTSDANTSLTLETSTNDIQINEISSSNMTKSDEESPIEANTSTESNTTVRKRKSIRVTPRIYQTRQLDRKTRSNRIFGIENEPRTAKLSAKRVIKKLDSATPKKKIAKNTCEDAACSSSKNKENKNVHKSTVPKSNQRALRSSQTDSKPEAKSSVIKRIVAVARSIRVRKLK